ncbi:DsrE family protein [Ottowia thiooxydans]|uniref:DsrE family protein n=1 Tax=Ottowia thiooxydans TaxID=219182 RepID=UPI00040D5084|nr:DsrE family protein [Ottowia thiooxydans]
MKTVIVVFSDPKSGSEEALGRVFNALFLAYELKDKGQEFDLVFQGTGVRWPAELAKNDHPAHALYEAVLDHIVACGGCADVFGAGAGLAPTGIALVRDKTIPGTTGVLDLSRHLDAGNRLVTF